jgi:hypothetical protein
MKRARGSDLSTRTGWLAVVFMFLLVAPHRAPAQDWQTFKYPASAFSAAFPAAPQEDTRQIETSAGSVELHTYTLEMDQVALFVGVCDYGSKAEGNNADAMLEGAKKGALENSKAQLTRESKISLGNNRGVEFESEGEGTHYIARIYLVGTIMYQTLVVYPSAGPYADATRFLDSFQLMAHSN